MDARAAGVRAGRATFARFVAATFLWQLAFQSTYFVGIIGCATYDLGADAQVVSLLTLIINVVQVVSVMVAGVVVDRVGPCRTLLVTLVALSACGLVGWLAALSLPTLALIAAVESFAAASPSRRPTPSRAS